MNGRSCRVCGGAIGQGESRCPHCGTPVGSGISRVWVLTFFVMGVALGLLLLLLQQPGLPDGVAEVTAQPAPVKSQARAIEQPRPRKVVPKPKPKPKPEPIAPAPVQPQQTVAEEPPLPATANPTIEPMNCDRRAAEAVRDKARTLATITQRGETVQLNLTRQWEYYLPGHRRSFVETFAEADRCLHGRPRVIRFNFRGVEVARVSADGAIVMK